MSSTIYEYNFQNALNLARIGETTNKKKDNATKDSEIVASF